MFRISVVSMFMAAALVAQQPGRQIMAGSSTLPSGMALRFRSMLESNGNTAFDIGQGLGAGGASFGADAFHRVMIDKHTDSYFGYDLVIGPGSEADGYLATFKPPTNVGYLLERSAPGRSLKPMPPPAYPAPLVIRDRDVIKVDLMVSPDGKQRLTDYIEFFAHKPEPEPASTTAEPRDFTLDDGPLTFDPMFYTVWIQGNRFSGNTAFDTKPGSTFWLASPGDGRYILSVVPFEGFVKAGAIRDNVISFRDSGKEYEVRFLDPIAGKGKAWNVYLRHDTAYIPVAGRTTAITMGTDRIENLLPKR